MIFRYSVFIQFSLVKLVLIHSFCKFVCIIPNLFVFILGKKLYFFPVSSSYHSKKCIRKSDHFWLNFWYV